MTNAGNERAVSWLKDPYRLIHMDAHLEELKEIYMNFDAEPLGIHEVYRIE